MNTRLYFDVSKRGGHVTGVLELTDEKALDMLVRGWDLRPLGWKISDLLEEVATELDAIAS